MGIDVSQLSSVQQNYLKVIWTNQEWTSERVSTKSLAEKFAVSTSTVSETVRKLANLGLVEHAKYGAISLTGDGDAVAVAMVRRHRLLETYLSEELGYSWDEVHAEAEVLEHAVSERMISRMDAKLGFPNRDPHGDRIPSADGRVTKTPARQLYEFANGEVGQVVQVSDSDPNMLRYFGSLGISLGIWITLVKRHDFAGTVLIRVGDCEKCIEVGASAARSIRLA